MSSLKYKKSVIAEKTKMSKSNLKQVLISILIGAVVSFLSTLFAGLAEVLKAHSTEIVSGVASAGVYLAKAYKA